MTHCNEPPELQARNPDWQNEYRQHRPMVERSIAWLTRGNRKVRYRGVAKNDHWLHHRAAAINLRRLITLRPRTTPAPTGPSPDPDIARVLTADTGCKTRNGGATSMSTAGSDFTSATRAPRGAPPHRH